MHAQVLHEAKQPLAWQSRDDLVPGVGQVVVTLRAAALNRRDFWITQGMYPGIRTPVVLGSDGAGTVTRVGDGVTEDWSGRDVILNPGLDWGDSPRAQGERFHILGMPTDGTFAEQVLIDARYVHPKPAHLDWHEAAALPLAGLTAYRAVFEQGQLQAGETVLVSGIGGGVATFALQFAVRAGARAVVTSSSPAKIARAIELGAAGGYDYRDTAWAREFAQRYGAAGLVIDGAGGAGYASLVEIAGPGGRIVNYGATAGSPEKLDLFKVFWKQLRLQGTTMGSPHDFSAMCDFVVAHDVRPIVDRVLPLVEANAGAGGHADQRAVWEDRLGSERRIDGRNARRPALGSRVRTRWEAEGLF